MAGDRHALHSMCSYLGCFPPAVPRRIIDRIIPPRGIVLDPFCGSGTTLVEAVLAGRDAVGIDLNPLAIAVAQAKTAPVEIEDVLDRVLDLARGYRGRADLDDVPDGLRIIFHPRTLSHLGYLRAALDMAEPVDRFIRGAVLGIMHGKFRADGRSSYLSIDMPNTFSMSPEYVRKFVKKHRLKQPPADVFGKIRERVRWLLRHGALPHSPTAKVIYGDATNLPTLLLNAGVAYVHGVVTSPPYLGVLRYGAFNWIRLWFLGLDPSSVDRSLDNTDSLDRYLSFMSSFLASAAEVLRVGAPLALVIGDVVEFGTRVELAKRVWAELDGIAPFKLTKIHVDAFDPTTKTTRIWGEARKGRATPLDRILVLERVAPKRARARTG